MTSSASDLAMRPDGGRRHRQLSQTLPTPIAPRATNGPKATAAFPAKQVRSRNPARRLVPNVRQGSREVL